MLFLFNNRDQRKREDGLQCGLEDDLHGVVENRRSPTDRTLARGVGDEVAPGWRGSSEEVAGRRGLTTVEVAGVGVFVVGE